MVKMNMRKIKDTTEQLKDENNSRSITCCNCSNPATHKLVTGLGCYPNYHESFICNMCSDRIKKLSDYQWDVHRIIGVYNIGMDKRDLKKYNYDNSNMENTPNNSMNTKNYTLVYFGVGWDIKSANKQIFKKFNHFIFVDSLPKLSHYEPGMAGYEKSKDEDSLINTLKNNASRSGYKLRSIEGNLLTFIKGNKKIEYYMNTTVTEALDDPIIRKKMNEAKWVHEKGFHPYEYGLKVGDLPNLLEYRAKIKEL